MTRELTERIQEEAIQWVLQGDAGFTPQEQCALESWLVKSSAHREAYQHYTRLWKNLDDLGRRRAGKAAATTARVSIVSARFAVGESTSRGSRLTEAAGVA